MALSNVPHTLHVPNAPIVTPPREETVTLQELEKRLSGGGITAFRRILEGCGNEADTSNLCVVDVLRSASLPGVAASIAPMMALLNSGAFRVKRMANRPPEELENSLPTSRVFDCRTFSEGTLTPQEWDAAYEELRVGLARNLTAIDAPASGDEPDIAQGDADVLARGLRDLGRLYVELLGKGQEKSAVEWMTQVILRSPDDETCSDGPPFHIDEGFYYLHGLITWLSAATLAVDIRDEIKSGPGRSAVRNLAVMEHTPDSPRAVHEKRFAERPMLSAAEVTRVLQPATGSDVVFYYGGEDDCPGTNADRAAIHQGPWVTDTFRERGRLTLFFACCKWGNA